MIRGILSETERFKLFLQAQMWTWKRKDLKGNIVYSQVQGALRECGFCYEYVFPKEHLAEVLTMLHVRDRQQLPKISAWAIRKVLGNGVKPIPKYKDFYNLYTVIDGKPMLFLRTAPMEAVALYPIGIKEDNVNRWEDQGFEQEML